MTGAIQRCRGGDNLTSFNEQCNNVIDIVKTFRIGNDNCDNDEENNGKEYDVNGDDVYDEYSEDDDDDDSDDNDDECDGDDNDEDDRNGSSRCRYLGIHVKSKNIYLMRIATRQKTQLNGHVDQKRATKSE